MDFYQSLSSVLLRDAREIDQSVEGVRTQKEFDKVKNKNLLLSSRCVKH